ncbi:hypothetical protein ABE65_006650 [Fictibacillus phosphorivorans]|uniref:Uncharacterized protein n=1 Tax=Fictibacillus phosphorivorans TaxID=1221500 RepID=A0A160IKE8_9BACL|nr:hypothetical protein [Fictibacillus phosphorivorans]ANC76494.1 hypothetical protein ABE65_006650 [Fictibacillus phosphorivorans]
MNLIETYISEVTQRLPEKIRDDIAMELRSTIEDMLPDQHTDRDVEDVLMKLGDPIKLATEYNNKPRYIIGPMFYESYINILIVAAIISIVVSSLMLFVNGMITFEGDKSLFTLMAFIGQLCLKMLLSSLNVLFQVFFWVTIVFIMLERSGVSNGDIYTKKKKTWSPSDLYKLEKVVAKRQIPKAEVFFSLFWTALWAMILFNSSEMIGWYEQTGKGLEGLTLKAPLFNEEVLFSYAPFIVLLIFIEVSLAIYKFFIGRWTILLASLNLIYHLISVGLFCFMLTDETLYNKLFVEKLNITVPDIPAFWFISTIATIIAVCSIIDIISGFNKANKSNTVLDQWMKNG